MFGQCYIDQRIISTRVLPCFGLTLPILLPIIIKEIQKASNAYEKFQIPLKGTLIPKIVKLNPNQGQHSEKGMLNLPKCWDKAQLTNESS